jgi:hypothetical protein
MVRRRAAPSPDDASHRSENHEAGVGLILRDARQNALLTMRVKVSPDG